MVMHISTVLKHYKRKAVQEELVRCSTDREVVGSYSGQGFGKRPDVIQHPGDVIELVKNGITSFHMSEELWQNPLQLSPMMKKNDIDSLRKGWDLILDIDCPILEYSKHAAFLLIEALKYHGLKSYTIKFSGNHGYHIGVPFEAFPSEVLGKETRLLFPEAPRRIASYLSDFIKKHLSKRLLKIEGVDDISKKVGKPVSEMMKDGMFNPMAVLEIDTLLISSRHLCRMPYSFNEKSGLVSVPIEPSSVLDFDKESAKPQNVKVNEHKFLSREGVVAGEAKQLIVQAFDYNIKTGVKVAKEYKEEDIPQEAIPADLFPPCINNILEGVKDGRKRCVFILVNFLTSVGWGYDQIEDLLVKWNKKNEEELREVFYLGQLRYHKQQKKRILPPNCKNQMYYKDLHICTPDSICRKISNPVNYAKRKAFLINLQKKSEDRKWSDEKKEEMRKLREERKKFKEDVKRKKEAGELE